MRRYPSSGFTYIELVIGVSIMAITLTFAGPSLQQYNRTQRVKSTAREIYTKLQMARMTAIKENVDVNVSFTLEGANSPSMTITKYAGAEDVLPETRFYQEAPYIDLGTSGSGQITFGARGTTNPGQSQTLTVRYRDDPDIDTLYEVVISSSTGSIRFQKREV